MRVHVLGRVDSKSGDAHINKIVKESGYLRAHIVAIMVEIEQTDKAAAAHLKMKREFAEQQSCVHDRRSKCSRPVECHGRRWDH